MMTCTIIGAFLKGNLDRLSSIYLSYFFVEGTNPKGAIRTTELHLVCVVLIGKVFVDVIAQTTDCIDFVQFIAPILLL